MKIEDVKIKLARAIANGNYQFARAGVPIIVAEVLDVSVSNADEINADNPDNSDLDNYTFTGSAMISEKDGTNGVITKRESFRGSARVENVVIRISEPISIY